MAELTIGNVFGRAMDFYVYRQWANGFGMGMDQILPWKPQSLFGVLMYAFTISVVVILFKKVLDKMLKWAFNSANSGAKKEKRYTSQVQNLK